MRRNPPRKWLAWERPWYFSYLPPVAGLAFCFMTFFAFQEGDTSENTVILVETVVFGLGGVVLNLSRLITTLQKPYRSSNIHIALGSILATVVLFAMLYNVINLFMPNSFFGLSGSTPVEDFVNVIYFSAATCTTTGFGDIYPVSMVAKAAVSIQMMTFFVFFVVLIGNHQTFIKPKVQKE